MSFLKAVAAANGTPTVDAAPSGPAQPAGGDTPYGMKALADECDLVAAATEGTRNDTLNTAAFRIGRNVAAGKLTEGTARINLEAAGRAAGLDQHETAATVNSGLGSGRQHPRVVAERPARPDVELSPWEVPTPATPAMAAADLDAFWTARPELDHIRTFARARRASPWAVLGVILARVTVAVPPWVVLPPLVGTQASMNLFVALVAPSGGGKGAAESCAADAIGLGPVDSAGVGSGEGIAHLFARRTKDGMERIREAVLMRVAEIDTLAALGDRKGATLLPELRKAWSGEDLGFAYADPTKALSIVAHSYRLSLVAGVQPGRAQWVLDDSDGGTPQRFLWLPAVDPDAPDTAPDAPSQMAWSTPKWPTAEAFTGRVNLTVCQTARTLIDTNRLARLRGDGEALDGHALLCRLKVAAALAILNKRPFVDDDDWELSGHISALSEATRTAVVDGLKREAAKANRGKAEAEADRAITVSGRQEAEALKRAGQYVLRKLRAHPDGLTRGELSRGISTALRGHLGEALDHLVTAGQVAPEDAVHRAGTGTRWKAVCTD